LVSGCIKGNIPDYNASTFCVEQQRLSVWCWLSIGLDVCVGFFNVFFVAFSVIF
jgi:hypothetical protein